MILIIAPPLFIKIIVYVITVYVNLVVFGYLDFLIGKVYIVPLCLRYPYRVLTYFLINKQRHTIFQIFFFCYVFNRKD